MMKILGINTALPITEIALIKDGKAILTKSWQSNHDEAEKILPEIISALPPQSQLDQIFVVSGPGSYTGLRIGVTAANTIAMLKQAKIHSMNTFDFIRSRLHSNPNTAIILRAGGQNIAVTLHTGEEPQQIPLTDLAQYLNDHNIEHYFTERQEIAEHLTQHHLSHTDLQPFTDFLQTNSDQTLYNQTLIRPIYLNPPQITPSKNALRRSNPNR